MISGDLQQLPPCQNTLTNNLYGVKPYLPQNYREWDKSALNRLIQNILELNHETKKRIRSI